MSASEPFSDVVSALYRLFADAARQGADAVRREVRPIIEARPEPPQPTPAATAGSPGDLLTADAVAERVSLSKRSVRRAVLSGDFPPPLVVGKRAIRWRREDVDLWLASRRGKIGGSS